jgi:hypothetical protein
VGNVTPTPGWGFGDEPMTMLIEFRVRRTGEQLTAMPVYEFLRALHDYAAHETIPFDELLITIDGQEVLPSECGHA